jgi:hypothetical protein
MGWQARQPTTPEENAASRWAKSAATEARIRIDEWRGPIPRVSSSVGGGGKVNMLTISRSPPAVHSLVPRIHRVVVLVQRGDIHLLEIYPRAL